MGLNFVLDENTYAKMKDIYMQEHMMVYEFPAQPGLNLVDGFINPRWDVFVLLGNEEWEELTKNDIHPPSIMRKERNGDAG